VNSLYSLSTQCHALSALSVDDDIDEQALLDTLEGVSGELQEKTANVVAYAQSLDGFADLIEAKIEQMQARADRMHKRAGRVREYVKECLERAGVPKVVVPEFAIAIRKNPPRVMIDDAAVIPADLMVTPPTPSPYPDKAGIKAALQAGRVVPGARLEQSTRLDIR
jgi:hypothetical protein